MTVVFIIILIAAIGAYIYVSLPKSEKMITQEKQGTSYVLTVRYGDEVKNYTLDDLKSMPSIPGYGGYVKKNNVTVGPNLYRGVPLEYILQEFSLPENYSITVIASDGYEKDYSMDMIKGKVDIYNESGNYIGVGNLTMILAYEKDGSALGEDEGPLRVAFVSEDGYLTPSNLWVRNVVSIEIVEK
ncbi:MAG: hypothetical protein DRN09_03135 [Thermoplasmata archaeon]|nr:MAG: hypothetical protein DRN09_03135 [Thermoplasmata archaeon]